MEIGRPSAENVTLGLRPRVTFSTLGSSYFHVPLTTVRHVLILKPHDWPRDWEVFCKVEVSSYSETNKKLQIDMHA